MLYTDCIAIELIMSKTSFANWQLSSSDCDSEEEQVTKGRLLTVKSKERSSPSNKADIIDVEEYVSLADRLKRQQKDEVSINLDDDDDLPEFCLPSKSPKNETSIDLHDKPSSLVDVPVVVVSRNEEMSVVVQSKVCKKSQDNSKDKGATSSLNARLKALKPEECLKYMSCKISSKLEHLFEKYDLLDNIRKDFIPSCVLVQSETPYVRWQRMVPSVINTESQSEGCEEENDVLVAITATEFIKMINASTADIDCEETLSSWIKKMHVQWEDSQIHLVCIGLEEYKKSVKAKKARLDKNSETSKKRKKTAILDVSFTDIETASIELQIKFNITITYVETAAEFVTLVKQMTKSVGEAPYKRMKRQDVQFMNEIPSVKIDAKTGEGKRKAWKQMIQQFHNVTAVMATAITDRYPSIISLMRAYEECGTDANKAEMLLSEIPVRRGVGTLQTSRRIGPELSYKIYRQLTSPDPDERLY